MSSKGVEPDPEKLAGIKEFQTPTDKEGVMRFLGAISQFRKWNPDITASSTQLRKLLTKGTVFTWDKAEMEEFENLKSIVANLKWVTPFDVNLKTRLLVDSSKISGIGYILLQETGEL